LHSAAALIERRVRAVLKITPPGSGLPSHGREVLVLYLERRRTTVRSGMPLAGCFGYSDLKEAAPMEGYVL
jgi:hypothetical protein